MPQNSIQPILETNTYLFNQLLNNNSWIATLPAEARNDGEEITEARNDELGGDSYQGVGDSYQILAEDTAQNITNIGNYGQGNIQSKLLASASIEGGSININAANDFTNLAADITSSEDATIIAGNNVNIQTLQLRNRSEEKWGSKKKGGEKITDITTNLQSEINSAHNIAIIALGLNNNNNTDSGNITLQAAKIKAQDDIDIIANNNLLLLTSTNSSFILQKTHDKGTFAFTNGEMGRINSSIINNEISTP